MSAQPAQIGPYRILKRIGTGGMGEVYLAMDERLDRRVAVKTIRPDSRSSSENRARFEQEARLAARLNHPSIVQVYDVLHHEGLDCIVMEYVKGTTLRRLLAHGPLAADRVISLARQIGRGLFEAHRRGVVHRDLKPENILLTEAGQAKMTDFGIAKPMADEGGQEQTALTQTGSLVGTCRAMSPEQIQGDPVGPQSDLFSLGSLLYEALTGRSPFQARTELLSLNQIIHHRQPPASQVRHEVPQQLSDLIDQLLEKEPLHRPRSISEVNAALDDMHLQYQGADSNITRIPGGGQPNPATAWTTPHSGSSAIPERQGRVDSGTSSTSASEAERRPLTVLCCELASRSSNSSEVEPEDQLAAIQAFQATCTQIIEEFKGYPGHYLDSGMTAYFGYPQASEHAVQRAALASLDILSAMDGLNSVSDSSLHLQARLGIHNAPAVVGGSGAGTGQTQLVLGDGPREAGRLARLAEPDTILASRQAQRLLTGLFRFQEMTLADDAGKAVQAYRILAPSGATDRIEAALLSGLTPLVGRDRELDLLKQRCRQADQGRGQVVLLSGEAGMGKSRLAQAFKDIVADPSTDPIEWRCSPYHCHSAYHPVIAYLERSLKLNREDATDLKQSRLKKSLQRWGLPLAQALPLLADLLSVGREDQLGMSPQLRKQRTLQALLTWLLARAERQTLLCLVEDIHWIDPSTLELLTALIEQVPAGRILLLCTFRTAFQPPWGIRSHITQLNVDRLEPDLAAAMIEKVSGGKALPEGLVEQLVQKTDGVPLFVEELTKMVLESGMLAQGQDGYQLTGPLPPLAVPDTLQDSLLARLDAQGGAAKQIAQIGAVIGREFSRELLMAVSGMEEEELKVLLNRLVGAELLFRQGFLDQARYSFKHALIRDAAYQSLLKRQRQRHHARIAEILESQFPRSARSQPELLAHHWTQAGHFGQAVEYWRRAGQRSLERSAITEARDHINSGLKLLPKVSPGIGRDEQELALQTALGTALSITLGYGVPQVAQAFERALEICRNQKDSPQLFWALWGLRRYYSMRAEFKTALQLGHRLLRLCKAQPDASLKIAAHFGLGATLFVKGQFQDSDQHFKKAIEYDSPQRSTHLGVPSGEDSGVFSLCFSAAVLWFLGFPQQASLRIDQAYRLAKQISHSFSLSSALQFRAFLAQLSRDPASVLEYSRKDVDKARQQGSFAHLVQSRIFLGWAMACVPGQNLRDIQQGIRLIRRGIADLAAAGSVTWHTYNHSLLSEACCKSGQPDAAQRCLNEALEVAERTGENFYLAELQRLCGELRLPRSDQADGQSQAEAEAQFHKAQQTARRQGARILELRAAVSLGRLWKGQGKHLQARQLIEGLLAGFEEGSESHDLRQARELVTNLAG